MISPRKTVTLDDIHIKKFNSIPKKIRDFYKQMEDGDEFLPKFEQLPEIFKRNKHTKAAYSKRKTIYMYMKKYQADHLLGIEATLSAFESMSTLQLYEKIKKCRPITH